MGRRQGPGSGPHPAPGTDCRGPSLPSGLSRVDGTPAGPVLSPTARGQLLHEDRGPQTPAGEEDLRRCPQQLLGAHTRAHTHTQCRTRAVRQMHTCAQHTCTRLHRQCTHTDTHSRPRLRRTAHAGCWHQGPGPGCTQDRHGAGLDAGCLDRRLGRLHRLQGSTSCLHISQESGVRVSQDSTAVARAESGVTRGTSEAGGPSQPSCLSTAAAPLSLSQGCWKGPWPDLSQPQP